MFRRWRLKKIHAKFLESCRNLKEGREFWGQASPFKRWFFQLITPVPLLGLLEDGQRLLAALDWLEAHCRERPLGEQVVRKYHKLVYTGDAKDSGEYRRHEIVMTDSAIKRRPAQKVIPAMKAFESRLLQYQGRLDEQGVEDKGALLRMAVEVHHQIGLIHPFVDANGRVARLSMNHLLRRYGEGYVIYPPLGESTQMWDALQTAHQGNLGQLVEIAKKRLYKV